MFVVDQPEIVDAHARHLLRQPLPVDQPVRLRVGADKRSGQQHSGPLGDAALKYSLRIIFIPPPLAGGVGGGLAAGASQRALPSRFACRPPRKRERLRTTPSPSRRIDHVAVLEVGRGQHGLVAHALPDIEARALLDAVVLHLQHARTSPTRRPCRT